MLRRENMYGKYIKGNLLNTRTEMILAYGHRPKFLV